MSSSRLSLFGLSAEHRSEATSKGHRPARVSVEHQDRYTLITEEGDEDCFLLGKLFLDEQKLEGLRPVVGDWVGLNNDRQISALLNRRTLLRRQSVSKRPRSQSLAANVDTVLIVTSCNQEFSERKLERYIAAVMDSGASPIVVLSKVDLVDSTEPYVEVIRSIALDVPVLRMSPKSGEGLESLTPYLEPQKTVAMLGSSGVGKSTLGNLFLGDEILKTGAIREKDDKGRHTTTRRELLLLPEGRGMLIDTPGMREMALWIDEKTLHAAFPDVNELSFKCRFRDCAHQGDLGCALLPPAISEARLKSYLRLKEESDARFRR